MLSVRRAVAAFFIVSTVSTSANAGGITNPSMGYEIIDALQRLQDRWGAAGDYKVVAVLDGDTIDVVSDGEDYRVRLSQIDAPERGQEWGGRSREYLVDLIQGKYVRVDYDGRDQYGRIIGDVYADIGCGGLSIDCAPVLINRLMVNQGFAWAYRQYVTDQEYLDIEGDARNAGRGLWSSESPPTPPWEFRQQ